MTGREWRKRPRRAVVARGLSVVLIAGALAAGRAAAAELTETEVKKLGEVPTSGFQEVAVSSDGEHLAVAVRRANGCVVVCDGKESPAYNAVRDLTLSWDGRLVGYAASDGGEWFVVVSGKRTTGTPSVAGPVISANGRRVAWYAAAGQTGTVYLDGEPQKNHTALEGEPPAVSPDGSHVAFIAQASGTVTTAVGLPGRHETSTHGSAWGITDRIDRRTYMACDRSRGRLYYDLRCPVFSPNSARLAYAGRHEGGWFIVCDNDRVAGPCADVSGPVWAPNSRALAFAAQRDGKWAVVSGKKSDEWFDAIGQMAFSPGSNHLAYAAKQGGSWLIVCDGKKGPSCEEIGWVGFSFDSRHLVYAARKGGGWVMVVDGLEGPAHTRLEVPGRAGASKSGLRYVTLDGGEAQLVEVKWPAETDWTNGLK